MPLSIIEAGVPKEDVEGIEAPQKHKYFVATKSYLARRGNMDKKITLKKASPWVTRTHRRIETWKLDWDILLDII